MSDKMRWRYNDTNDVVAAVDAATVIKLGDILYQDVDDAKPASGIRNPFGLAANQESLANNFLGVAMQRSRAGDTDPIRVATTGVFEFDCLSDTFELGDLIGAAPDDFVRSESERNHVRPLKDQGVIGVTSSKYAIARVAKRAASEVTSVLVDIRSTVMTGGVKGGSPRGV